MLSSPGTPTPACSESEAEKSQGEAPAAGEGVLCAPEIGSRLCQPRKPVVMEAPPGASRGAVGQPCEGGGQVHTAPGWQRALKVSETREA